MEKRKPMSSEEKYITIYRKFRPETFEQVLGQSHVVKVLRNQIMSESTGHAYLFCGTRGTGKTTMARLLAKGVNCLSEGTRPCGECDHCRSIRDGTFVDVIEIDAASNNSVDNVRELRESVIYTPVVGRKKVFIVDEVHMFSKSAFNALLKTLEEPPDHVIFILATTEAGKLPATILSRCLQFDFKRLPAAEIMKGMRSICTALGMDAEDAAIALLARKADGSVRDGLSILEQCVTAGEKTLSLSTVLEILGSPDDDQLAALTEHVAAGQTAEALILVDEMLQAGKEERRIIEDWIEYFHSSLMVKFLGNPDRILGRSTENIAILKKQSEGFDVSFINDNIYRLSKLLNESRWSPHVRILLEMTLIEMSEGRE